MTKQTLQALTFLFLTGLVGLVDVGVAQEVAALRLPPPDAIASEQFTFLRSLRELSDGTVLAGDLVEQRLVSIDLEAGTTREIGRSGEGPGEYRGIGGLFPLGADSTLFVDSYLGRWNFLHHAEIARTVGPEKSLNRLFQNRRLSGASSAGGVLGVRPRMDFDRSADSLLVILADRGTEEIDTVAVVRGIGQRAKETVIIPPAPNDPPRLIGSNPLAAADDALLFPDGWIAVARIDPYRVDWRTADGTWVRGAPVPVEAVEVDDRERCEALRRLVGLRRPCRDVDLNGWPERMPPFLARRDAQLFATSDGHLVIHRASTADRPGNRYDVIDRRGNLRAVLELPENVRILGFGEGTIYTVLEDQFDFQTLRRHPWPSAGGGR